MQTSGTLDQQSQHKDVLVQQWQSVTTTPRVLFRSLIEKICLSCISRPSLTALFASESSLKLYSLFFKPHPRSLDFFPACLLETAESAPFLPSVSSLSFQQTPCCWVKNCLLSLSPIQNWLLVHVPQSFILLQSSIQMMFFFAWNSIILFHLFLLNA